MPFLPIPLPVPAPPIPLPGGWDPGDEMPDDRPRGPSAGQIWEKIKDALGVGADSKVEPQAQTRDTDCSQTSNKNQCNACMLGEERETISERMRGFIRFDGFWRDVCTAVEAKAHYKQFFNEDNELHFWARAKKGQRNILDSWQVQASAQSTHIARLGAPAKIEWHFLEAESYAAAINTFGPLSAICRFTP